MAKRYQLGVELDRDRFRAYGKQADRFAEIMEELHGVSIPRGRAGAVYMRWLIDHGDEFLDELEGE